MLNKRRRASSVASRQEEEIADDSTPEQSPVLSVGTIGTGRKRKKLDPSELCQQLYDSIRNIKKEDGSMLCDTFIRAPKRRQEPSYYEVVNNPIDLLRVQQKLKTDSYDDIEELTSDLELLVNNAKAFYKPGSNEYNDACLLWESFNTNKMKLLESIGMEDEPRSKRVGRQPRRSTANEDTQNSSHNSSNNDDDFDPYEELFTAVMTATDPIDDRPLHLEFQLLPSKKLWPDYYDVIEHPIDLRLIATKIQTNAYSSLSEMEKDLLQMTKNAVMFNEPGSQIYKDAKTLKKVFTTKKAEIELGKAKPTVSKKRGQSWSAITAALKEEPESSDDDSEGNQNKCGEGPMWQLFDTLFNAASATDPPNATGAPLGQSLWKLPYRRFHPEYYETIKKPISMAQIQKKLKRGDYANISDLTADLYLMLDNAKRAYPPSHKTHKDAVKMLKLMNSKLVDSAVEQEPSDIDEQDQSNASSTSSNRQKKRQRSSSTVTPPTATNTTTNSVSTNSTTTATTSPKGKPQLLGPALKKKLLSLQKYLTDYTIGNRKPMGLFMEKPSKKLYPDYYNIIQHPIDMNTIENNIRSDKYATIEDCISDYRLMFDNCRKFNEEGSMIYEDANVLEKALNDKLKELSVYNEKKPISKFTKTSRKTLTPREAKLWQLYETIRDYHEPKGNRQLSLIFTKLPSKNNILKNIHKCSWTIEQFEQAIGFLKEGKSLRQVAKQCGIPESTLREKRRELMNLKNDYPDYYDIIKNPIDMEKILQKLKQQVYDNVDEMAADFLLMFENACKYNEPDSQIYKDALVLQQLCIQTKQSLKDNDETVPDVGLAVQELLLSLFTALYNHQDEEGRCYSDSLAELPEYDEIDAENKVRGISLDLVKRRLDKGLYKRLDIFQEDIFSCLERARKLSRTDSQVFEDSIELQAFFIKKRDELCKDVLTSPALSYSSLHLSAAVEAVRQSKLLKEEEDSDDVDEAATGESMTIDQKVYSPGDFVYFDSIDNKSTYYSSSCPESNRSTLKQNKIPISVPGIAYIERLYTDTNNVKMCYGNIFLRPPETYHVTTRKFLEQEVFKSDQHQAIPLDKLMNKCYVMSIKDYIKYKPEGFQDKDVYVCESRYSLKARSFKKIKSWPFVRDNDAIKFIQRETPLELKRIMSVFKERVEKHKGELAELQLQEALVEKDKPNVACFVKNPEEGNTYFEQYNTICSGVVKTGDYVYVATQSGKQSIAQIHSIWETMNGKSYFQGPWLLTPTELPVQMNRHFYKQELLLSTVQDTNPIIAIVGRCAVLDYTEYTTCRPTEIQESDVYICETTYDEVKKSIKKFVQGQTLKKFTYSQMVTQDEIFHFKKPIKPRKMHISAITASQQEQIKSPLISDIKSEPSDVIGMMDDSLDGGGPPSVNSDILTTSSPAPSIASTPISTKTKSGKPQKKIVTGYILYSSEVRRGIRNSNPDASFGDVSRMVGIEWKNLPSTIRQSWEDKAAKINEESNAKYLVTDETTHCSSPVTIATNETAGPQQVYECLWDKCDYQFEDPIDCMQHCIADGTGHVQTYYADKGSSEGEFQCLWKSCMRFKKNMTPFPSLTRLIKHVREVHLSKGGKVVHTVDKSKTFVKSKNPTPQPPQTPIGGTMSTPQTSFSTAQQISPQASNSNQIQAPPEPLFVTVPPRPQRVLHSEAYIKYIEGLQNNANHITPWEKTLRANQQNVPPVDLAKLPTQWLGPVAKDKPEEVVNALWHLRNFMMKDVLEIRRNCF